MDEERGMLLDRNDGRFKYADGALMCIGDRVRFRWRGAFRGLTGVILNFHAQGQVVVYRRTGNWSAMVPARDVRRLKNQDRP